MPFSTRLLAPAALLMAAACSRGAPVNTGVGPESLPGPTEPREQTADQQVVHVLSRLTFGARPGDVARVREMGVDRWIDEQLQPERIDNRKVESFFAGFESYTTSAVELLRKYPLQFHILRYFSQEGPPGYKFIQLSAEDSAQLVPMLNRANDGGARIAAEILSGRVARALLTERQLQEVMTDFWLNHFSVYSQGGANDGPLYYLAEYENQTIRANALGKFRTLLEAVAKSPVMLSYLNNNVNEAERARPRFPSQQPPPGVGREMWLGNYTPWYGGDSLYLPARRPWQPPQLPPGVTPELAMQLWSQPGQGGGLNENYGRELLELHTLGVDGGYTQQDVLNAARALTGWTYLDPYFGGGEFVFVRAKHDAGEKVVLGRTLAAGRGVEDGEDLLDILSRHPSTARYIAFTLARRLVSDKPPQALVARAAETFRRTDGDIREVVRTIVTSPEFFATAAYRSKVKSPFELVTSALRALGAPPDPTQGTAQIVATLGQPSYGHLAPNGWPETGNEWMNTGAIMNRINFGMRVASIGVPGVSATDWPGAEKLKNSPLEKQVDGVIATLLGGEASPDTRAILLSGENPLLKSVATMKTDTTAAEQKKMAGVDPDPMMMTPLPRQMSYVGLGQLPQLKGLAQLVGLAIGSPEFQRR